MKLPVHDAQGNQVRHITVDDSVFGIVPNIAVLHQAFVAQRANQRRGSASTKTRSEVQGSTRKIRTQKYTGRARQGGIRSPVRVGGGVAFGPRPRSYRQRLLKKMKRLAIRSALSGKLADGQLRVVDQLTFAQPRTKDMVRVLHSAGIQRSALIVTGEPDRSVLVSARNLQKTKVLPAAYLNVVDLLTHRDLLLTEEAVRRVEGLWGAVAPEPAAVEKPKPRRRRARAAQEPPAETEAALEEPKARRRRATPTASAEPEGAPEKAARRTGRPKAKAGEKTADAAQAPQPARRRARAKKDEEP